MLVSLKSSGRHRLFQHIVNMRKSTVSRGLPPFFKISGRCHLAQVISCSWDLWLQVSHLPWWKGYPVLEGQVAVAGWIMPNSWHEMVGNRWRYSDLPNVPVAQRCQPGVLRQLQVKGTLSSELGRWLPVFHCQVHEGHRSLRIVVCVCSGFPSSVRLQSEWDVERCALQPVALCERNGCFSLMPSIWPIFWLQRRVEEGRRCRKTSQAAPSIADHRPRVHWT